MDDAIETRVENNAEKANKIGRGREKPKKKEKKCIKHDRVEINNKACLSRFQVSFKNLSQQQITQKKRKERESNNTL